VLLLVLSAIVFGDVDNPSQQVWAVELVPLLQTKVSFLKSWSASEPWAEKANADDVDTMEKVKSGTRPVGV
jgi:hypothetical protein